MEYAARYLYESIDIAGVKALADTDVYHHSLPSASHVDVSTLHRGREYPKPYILQFRIKRHIAKRGYHLTIHTMDSLACKPILHVSTNATVQIISLRFLNPFDQ